MCWQWVSSAQPRLLGILHRAQWIPPHERARAVSLTTSGMYLGSAAAMLVLPSCADMWGAPSLLKIVGGLGFAWLALWLVVGRDIPHRCARRNSTKSTSLRAWHPAACRQCMMMPTSVAGGWGVASPGPAVQLSMRPTSSRQLMCSEM